MSTPAVHWLDPMLPGPWEVVCLGGPPWAEGWTVLAPWTSEGESRHRPHVAECGFGEAALAEAKRIAAWCPQKEGR